MLLDTFSRLTLLAELLFSIMCQARVPASLLSICLISFEFPSSYVFSYGIEMISLLAGKRWWFWGCPSTNRLLCIS